MKIRLFAVAILIAAQSLLPAATFEGIVDFRFSISGPMQSMRYFLKPGYQRVEAGEGADAAAVIFDFRAKKSYIIMNADQSYMEEMLKLPEPETKLENAQSTGKVLTIAGFKCEQWTVKDTAGNHEVCLNDQLGGFVSMNMGMRQGGNYGTFERLVANRFPLQLITNGKLQFEVTKVETKNLDENLFKPPAGFQKIMLP